MGSCRRLKILVALIVLAGGAACSREAQLPDLQSIYQTTVEIENEPLRNPLIAVPGTLGSRLVDYGSGRVIWGGGGSRGISADPEDKGEYQLIALPISKGNEPLSSLTDSVGPDGVLEIAIVEILGVPVDIEVYSGIVRTLKAGGFKLSNLTAGPPGEAQETEADEPEPTENPESAPDSSSFRFDYDWRRDLIETAHRFGRYVKARQAEVARARGVRPEDVRFDLLAHSMGGLMSRYFLMYGFADPAPDGALPPITWEGAAYFSRVIFVAPPNGGSVIAMDNLINGKDFGAFQPVYPPALLGTHPSTYQLLPRSRHGRVMSEGSEVDIYDPGLWQSMGWGLADRAAAQELAWLMPEEKNAERRYERAVAHQARLLERAKTFHTMMDRWASPPPWLDLYLVVGGGFQTASDAEVDAEAKAFRLSGVEEGDGVVLRASALLDEYQGGAAPREDRYPLRFDSTLFLPDEHVELTKNPIFGDNLLFWLLRAPRRAETLARPAKSELLTAQSKDEPASASANPLQAGSER